MRYVAFFLGLVAFSCTSQTRYVDMTRPAEMVSLQSLNNVLRSYSSYLEEKSVLPTSSGLTQDKDGRILSVYLLGVSGQKLDVDGARELAVSSVLELLDRINGQEDLSHLLTKAPMPVSGIHFSLLFVDEKGEKIKDEEFITQLGLRDGFLTYYTGFSDWTEQDVQPTKAKNAFYSNSVPQQQGGKLLAMVAQESFQEALGLYQTKQFSSQRAVAVETEVAP